MLYNISFLAYRAAKKIGTHILFSKALSITVFFKFKKYFIFDPADTHTNENKSFVKYKI